MESDDPRLSDEWSWPSRIACDCISASDEPVSVETGLALDDAPRFGGASRLFIDDDESWLRALTKVALPRPLDGLREFRASAPKSKPKRLIISLPADGDGLARRLLDGWAEY